MVVLLLLIGMALGGLAGYVLGRAQGRRAVSMGSDVQVDELRSQLDQAQDRLRGSEAALVEARTKVDGLNRELSFVKSQLAQSQQAEQIRIEQERRRAQAQEEEKRRRQAQNLEEESKVLSALAPVQKNLDALQHKVAQIEEGRKQEMGKETSSLASALRNNKVRGAWGEAQLRNIVESAGLMEHVDFDTQVVVTASDGRVLRPDMVVHLPGGKTIPIDAKAPYSDYQRACGIPDTASDDELRRRDELLQAHARALREHVKVLADKEYWNAFETAPDFVVAFIPNDSLLQAALEVDPTLMDDAFAQKVALTSPVTLWAVLKSVAYAWQQQNLSEDARTLFTLTHELYDRFVVLGERTNKLGRSITATVTAYNRFASSLESRVLVTARKLQQMDPSKVIESVGVIDSDRGNIKELTAPEVLPDQEQ